MRAYVPLTAGLSVALLAVVDIGTDSASEAKINRNRWAQILGGKEL